MQFDQGKRGFSFSKEGMLDMRMDPDGEQLTAEEVVNEFSQEELETIFRELGEEPKWRKAADAIVSRRSSKPIKTTTELAELLASALGFKRRGRLHPATLVFQALRIVVNRELEALQQALPQAIQWLTEGGKIGVLSFHRLEDRLVKTLFRKASNPGDGAFLLKLLNKKPSVPSREEVKKNRRSRSAKMRFAAKL